MPSDLEGLERSLPTTPADVAALRERRADSYMTVAQIAAALEQLGTLVRPDPRDRPPTKGEPFRL